jgi:very-short-patch-repair endonuclease
MTSAEKMLWNSLRRRQLDGLKFRRQHPLGPFIVDFCCPERSLIVEVDGAVHEDQVEYDATRTEMLEEFGYYIIRFQNDEVMNQHDTVLKSIVSVAQNRTPARLIYKTHDN